MDTIERLAAALVAAHRSGAAADVADLVLDTARDAYAVQAAVAADLGPVGGFKVGNKPGDAPIMAPIPANRIVSAGASWPMGARIGIELEIGFRIDAVPEDPAAPLTVTPLVALELVETRLPPDRTEDPLLKLADFQSNGGLVVGAIAAGATEADFTRIGATLTHGADTILAGQAEVPGGSARAALDALRRLVGAHCGGLRPGHVVITGSLNGLTWVSEPGPVLGAVDGLGAVSVTLTR